MTGFQQNFMRFKKNWIVLLIIIGGLISACNPQLASPAPTGTRPPTSTEPTPSQTATRVTQTASSTPTPSTPTSTATITPTVITDGCRQPSENYARLSINGHVINQRTYEMLEYAAAIYGGVIDISGPAITQGSYTRAVEASFGTHAGGGAVDLSVMYPGTYTIHAEGIEPLIRALRLAGFAAWYRDFDELYDGSPVHIHAIAIGDQELSLVAREQLTGAHGYFLGYNGLPIDGGAPSPDPHGGPILCDWMINLGYPENTATPSP